VIWHLLSFIEFSEVACSLRFSPSHMCVLCVLHLLTGRPRGNARVLGLERPRRPRGHGPPRRHPAARRLPPRPNARGAVALGARSSGVGRSRRERDNALHGRVRTRRLGLGEKTKTLKENELDSCGCYRCVVCIGVRYAATRACVPFLARVFML